jgi:integrase
LANAASFSLEAARATARDWLALLAQGFDPRIELEEQKRKAAAAHGLTFDTVANAYIADRLRGKRQGERSAREIRSILVARWSARPIGAITRGDVISLIDDLKARARRNVGERSSGAFARIVFSHCRALFSWAALRYDLERSPCDRLKPSALGLVARPRARVLNDAEIKAAWAAAETMGYPFGCFIQMLLMTGARRSEVSAATWDEFDLAAKVWTIPASRHKAGSEHRVPLTDAMLELLGELPRYRSGDYLFSTTFGKTSIAGFSKYTAKLMRLVRSELGAMPSFALHDLRRSFRTKLSEIGISERVAELAIGHAPRNPLIRVALLPPLTLAGLPSRCSSCRNAPTRT